MKLSEIKGDRAIEVIADIMEPISNIIGDPEAKKIFNQDKNKEKVPVIKYLPKLLKTHKNDIYSMLAALDGISVDEYIKKANMVKIINDFSDVVTDDSITALFTPAEQDKAKN